MRRIFAILAVAGLGVWAAGASAAPAYVPAGSAALGAPDRWDYVVADPPSGRVYVAHGDQVAVVDGRTGALVGAVTGMPGGTHGVAISAHTGQGFTDDGHGGFIIAFDLKSLKVTKRLQVAPGLDAMARDPATGHVFVMDGDTHKITVMDPKSDSIVATIDGGEDLEYGAADGAGFLYVSGAGNRDLLKIDTRHNAVVARWPMPDCTRPHGMAIDAAARRAFMGCVNHLMMVVDTRTGRLVTDLPIGGGSDAVAFDSARRRVFSSNGLDGTITVYQEKTPDSYAALAIVPTQLSGRTMSVDPRTGRLFVAAARTDPPTAPGGSYHREPGSLRLLMFDPAP